MRREGRLVGGIMGGGWERIDRKEKGNCFEEGVGKKKKFCVGDGKKGS